MLFVEESFLIFCKYESSSVHLEDPRLCWVSLFLENKKLNILSMGQNKIEKQAF